LRDELAEKRGKIVVYRTWTVHPVNDDSAYLKVSDAVEPHPKFFFSMKHQGWDYWRWVKFNPSIGVGRHGQVVEASCQRSYEGKGAFPSYIARGVIDGFEEQAVNVNYTGGVRGLKDVVGPHSMVKGLWTWSRGDGNWGPYTKGGELWQELNCAVLSGFAHNTSRTEEDIFAEHSKTNLHLDDADAQSLRDIAIAAERATLKGRYCAAYDSVNVPQKSPSNTWMRDYAMGGHQVMQIATWLAQRKLGASARAEKADAVSLYDQMIASVDAMQFTAYQGSGRLSLADPQFPMRLRSSIEVGHLFFTAVQGAWDATILYAEGQLDHSFNVTGIQDAVQRYENAWGSYQAYLLSCPTCASTMFNEFCESAQLPGHAIEGSLPGTPSCGPGLGALIQQIVNATSSFSAHRFEI